MYITKIRSQDVSVVELAQVRVFYSSGDEPSGTNTRELVS
jgi:hypothetical protein